MHYAGVEPGGCLCPDCRRAEPTDTTAVPLPVTDQLTPNERDYVSGIAGTAGLKALRILDEQAAKLKAANARADAAERALDERDGTALTRRLESERDQLAARVEELRATEKALRAGNEYLSRELGRADAERAVAMGLQCTPEERAILDAMRVARIQYDRHHHRPIFDDSESEIRVCIAELARRNK
jgi:hypothetical protein